MDRYINLEPIYTCRVLIENDGDYLILQRNPDSEQPKLWEAPGGKIKPNETLLQTAVREALEECGQQVNILSAEPILVEDRVIQDGKHAGRRYKAFGCLAIARSKDIVLRQKEHVNGMWQNPSEIVRRDDLTPTSKAAFLLLAKAVLL